MILASLALPFLIGAQQIPDKSSVLYTGVPSCSSSNSIQMVTHHANAILEAHQLSVSSLTYLKNLTNQPASVTITIPIEGHNVDWGMTDNYHVSATIDDNSVNLASTGAKMVQTEDERRRASGIRADSYMNAYTFTVNFVPREAHSLKVQFSTPMGHAGLDGMQRIVVYDAAGAATWNGPVTQLYLSLHYSPKVVFQVYAALPAKSWEIGNTGAFIKQLDARPGPDSKFIFTYYPGGYEKIGG